MRDIHSANNCVYLRCLQRHTEGAEDYCVEVYYASYFAMVASIFSSLMFGGWRFYAAAKRITTTLKEHQL